jgi:hypothetical protein
MLVLTRLLFLSLQSKEAKALAAANSSKASSWGVLGD